MMKKCLKYGIFTSLIVLKEMIFRDSKRIYKPQKLSVSGVFLLSIIVFGCGETQKILFRKQQVGKLVSGAFKKFKEWWDRTKKPEVTEKARTSILEQLREARVRADQHNEQQVPKTHRTDLGMER